MTSARRGPRGLGTLARALALGARDDALRTREQVAEFFTGTDLVEPGVVPVEDWRPEPGTSGEGKSTVWCAVGRKR
jgi:hypothetical protein